MRSLHAPAWRHANARLLLAGALLLPLAALAQPADNASATAAAAGAAPAPAVAPAAVAVATDRAVSAAASATPLAPAATAPAPYTPAPTTIAQAAPGPSTTSLLQTVLALVLVLVLVGALAWVAKRYGPKVGGGNANLRLVSALNIGGRERVMVIEVADQWIVVGASPGRVNALATLPKPDSPAPGNATLAAQAPSAANFADWLKQTIDKRHAK